VSSQNVDCKLTDIGHNYHKIEARIQVKIHIVCKISND
jgi:hypothetical protein